MSLPNQIVLEAGDYLRPHLHDDLMISKDWADRFSNPDGPTGSKWFAENQHRYLYIGFLRRKIAFVPNFRRIRLSDWSHRWDHNFVTQKEDFAVMVAYFEDGIGRFGLIYDVKCGITFLRGWRISVYAMRLNWRPCRSAFFATSFIYLILFIFCHIPFKPRSSSLAISVMVSMSRIPISQKRKPSKSVEGNPLFEGLLDIVSHHGAFTCYVISTEGSIGPLSSAL